MPPNQFHAGATIGLLAGMGVRSTAPFLEMVIEECQRQYGATHQPDYPQMMVLSWPTPFWIDRPIDHEAMRRRMGRALSGLSVPASTFSRCPPTCPTCTSSRCAGR